MIIEHEGKLYDTVITKPILDGDLYYDCMTHEVRKCQSYICFDPWSLKLVEKQEKLSEKNKDDLTNWHIKSKGISFENIGTIKNHKNKS